jgi:hypothetical protein
VLHNIHRINGNRGDAVGPQGADPHPPSTRGKAGEITFIDGAARVLEGAVDLPGAQARRQAPNVLGKNHRISVA